MSGLSKNLARLSPSRRDLLTSLLREQGIELSPDVCTTSHSDIRIFPLSSAQRRLWVEDQLLPSNPAWNVAAAVRLIGPLRVEAVETALEEIVRRHEILRTTFGTHEEQPLQFVRSELKMVLPVLDFSSLPALDRDRAAKSWIKSEAQRPFDLARGPLFRAALLRAAEKEHLLFLNLHHIICDAWSIELLGRELCLLYSTYSSGELSNLSDLSLQYGDYALREEEWLQSAAMPAELEYWRRTLSGCDPLELPYDRPRPAVRSFRGALHVEALQSPVLRSLKELSSNRGATLFITLVAAFQTLLHLYSGKADIVVGTGITSRNDADFEPLIGLFVNLLVLRTNLAKSRNFSELLEQLKEAMVEAYSHAQIPFDVLMNRLGLPRDGDQTPLLQTVLVFQNFPAETFSISGLTMEMLPVDNGTTRFDLTVFFREVAAELQMTVQYNADLFEASTIQEMVRRYQRLLHQIVDRPSIRISDLAAQISARTSCNQRNTRQEKWRILTKVKPRAIDLQLDNLVKIGHLATETEMPALVEPAVEDFDGINWVTMNRDLIERHLLACGAILFRGFALHSFADFERFVLAFGCALFAENGELPRSNIGGQIYTPVNYPQEQRILWHNENSFYSRWPRKIWFYCQVPAAQGGETPIVDGRQVFKFLPPHIVDRFVEKGIIYVRNYGEGLGLSWREVFRTENKTEAEAKCRAMGMDFEWTAGGKLKTRSFRPAVIGHPVTGERVWFNQITHWHPFCLGNELRASLSALMTSEELPRNVFYGDGSQISDSTVDAVCQAYQNAEVCFSWHQGDVLMVDNALVSHARNAFRGPRQIGVAMGEMVGDVKGD